MSEVTIWYADRVLNPDDLTDEIKKECVKLVSLDDHDQLRADFEKVVKFYGSERSWHTHLQSTISANRSCIDHSDVESFERKESHHSYAKRECGGKLARELAKKYGVKI